MSFHDLYHAPITSLVTMGGSGGKLPAKATADLVSIFILDDTAAPSMFTLEFNNWDGANKSLPWSDDQKLFFPGQKIAISLGYVGQKTAVSIIEGEITSLEPVFRTQPSTIVVRGYDLRHRLLRGRQTESFVKMNDSAIAEQIANKAKINIQVDKKAKSSGVKHEYVLQHNQTDLAFLQERARRIGFELLINKKTLQFRPRAIKSKKTVSLKLGRDIIEFTPRLTTLSQVSEVTVQGWDVKKKKAIVGTASMGKELTKMGGKTAGPKATNGAFGKSTLPIVKSPVATQAEADEMALGQYNEMALNYISGEGFCYGRPDLKAGTVVSIEGVGKMYSGLYYITAVKHIWNKTHGYRLRFTYKRNAV
ncbi:hypothetical protein MNBD_CHLOROFLEXI01-379 [hydrothermal vent metagenome]|uniref:Phage protein D n=1 Tax=hydrothermal vent metagenome TaxID=652676 RepID=A0A3B0VKE5_9ZZZZ